MRLVFFGLPLAALLLEGDGHPIELAVLSPIEAAGRRRLTRRLGEQAVISAAELGDTLDDEVDARLQALEPDLIVSWFWTRKLPPRWLRRGRLGAIGAHPSLLPRHRGPDPFFWAIDSGDAETGVTVHSLSEEYDTGDVLAQLRLPIGDRNAWQLARALDRPSLRALREVVAAFARGQPPHAEPQTESSATWAPEPHGALLAVDFAWSTDRVLRRVRALSPVPGLALELCEQALFVTRAEPAREFPLALAPGEAAALGEPPTDVVIRTGDGAIRMIAAVAGRSGGFPEGAPLPVAGLAQLVASRTRAV